MPVQIQGKSYKTVVERVNEFRGDEGFSEFGIETKIIKFDDPDCIIRAVIKDQAGRIVATGLAHEVRGSTNVNKTSHVENCETSAIGRALAALGFGGTEYASGDEVGTAVINQAVQGATEVLIRLINALMMNHRSVMAIKQGINDGDLSTAAEEWFVLPEDVKTALWVAPSKGGVFSTDELKIMKSSEFRVAYYGVSDESNTAEA